MLKIIRLFVLIQAASLVVASLIHAGATPIRGYEDSGASTAEGIIAAVLLVGLVATFLAPAWARGIAIAVQVFALLGALVGLTLALTVGPTTVPDIVYHVALVLGIIWGLVYAVRARA